MNAIEGGYAGALTGSALNPALVPVGAVAGAVAGVADAFNPRDVWFLDIREFDGTEMTFRLGSKSDGDKLLVFLDSYFSL